MRALLWIGRMGTRVGAIAATVALVAGCVAAGALTAPPGASSPVSSSPEPTATSVPSPAAWGSCGSASEWVDYAPYTIASLAADGHIFVEGVATAFEPGVFNTADGKPPRGFFMRPDKVTDRQDNGHIYTPVVIQVKQVLAGDVKPGTLRAFIEGGTVGCWTVRLSGAPVVNLNERYVFILRGYHDADGKVVPGQHQVIFALPIDANDEVWADEGPMSLATLAQLAAKASPTPAP